MPPRIIEITEDEEVVPIPVDRLTRTRLVRLAEASGQHPSALAAVLLRDMLEDDALTNDHPNVLHLEPRRAPNGEKAH